MNVSEGCVIFLNANARSVSECVTRLDDKDVLANAANLAKETQEILLIKRSDNIVCSIGDVPHKSC